METRQTWIKPSDWADYVQLPKTVDYMTVIYPKVLDAQQVDLSDAIGWDFYRVLAAVLDNNGTVSGATVDGDAVDITQAAYDAIVPYLKPIVIYYAYGLHIEDFGVQETRYGARIKQNPHSKELSDRQVDRRLHRYKGRATHYLKRLCRYLEDNASLYPDWEGGISNSSMQGTPRISSIFDD